MRAHRSERAGFTLEIQVIGRCEVPDFVVIGVEPEDADQRFGRGIRQGAQQDGLDQAEDGGVDADAEGQGADGDQGKAGPFDQTSQREADHHRQIRRRGRGEGCREAEPAGPSLRLGRGRGQAFGSVTPRYAR